MEIQIHEKQKELETILDYIPAWIMYKNTNNQFVKVNKAFADVMGKSKEELEGKYLSDLYPQEQASEYWKDDKEVMNSDKAKIGIIESMVSPTGIKWVKTDKVPYKDENGKIIGVVVFVIDITDEKNAKEQVKKHTEELEKINKLMIGRELKMIELKKEIENKKNPNSLPEF